MDTINLHSRFLSRAQWRLCMTSYCSISDCFEDMAECEAQSVLHDLLTSRRKKR